MAGAVHSAQAWLMAQQDAESGLIGVREGDGALLDHALATYSLGELHVRRPSEASAGALDLALRYLESLNPSDHFALSDAHNDVEAERVEFWRSTTKRLRALFDAKTREEQLALSANFMDWRYLIYSAYSREIGAHDTFATLTYSIEQFAPSENAAWVEEQLDDFLTEDLSLIHI